MGNTESKQQICYDKNKEDIKARAKEWYQNHKNIMNERSKAWYHANKHNIKPDTIAARKTYQRKYYQKNKVEIHKRRGNNNEYYKQWYKEYYQKNKNIYIDDKLKRNKVYRSIGISIHHIVMGGGSNKNEGNLVKFN